MTTHPSPLRHPKPKTIAKELRRLADLLDTQGAVALERAEVLAARGYPSNTAGSGSRSSDTTSSTERAAGLAGDDGDLTPPDAKWIDVDKRAHRAVHDAWYHSSQALHLLGDILDHAPDVDVVAPGTGNCTCGCETFCSPRQNGPDDRIKSGLAPTCYRRFLRWRNEHGPQLTAGDYVTALRRQREIEAEENERLNQLRANLRIA